MIGDPERQLSLPVAHGRHAAAGALRVKHDLEEVGRGAQVTAAEEEVGVGVGHPVPEAVVQRVAGDNDDYRRGRGRAGSNVTDDRHARELIAEAVFVRRVHDHDVDLAPLTVRGDRFSMADCRHQLDVTRRPEGLDDAETCQLVVVDDDNTAGSVMLPSRRSTSSSLL